jgi:HPt (histidine-containing phosphotransfer) domain-containing protein
LRKSVLTDKDKAMENNIDNVSVSQIFNHVEYMEKLKGNEELAKELITDFLQDIPPKVEALINGFQDNDEDVIKQTAHLIKGVAGNICAPGLQKTMEDVEQAFIKKDKKLLKQRLSEAEHQFAILKNILENTVLF